MMRIGAVREQGRGWAAVKDRSKGILFANMKFSAGLSAAKLRTNVLRNGRRGENDRDFPSNIM